MEADSGAPTVRVLDAREEVAKLDQVTLAGALALPHVDWCDYGEEHPDADPIEVVYMDQCFDQRWSAAETVVAATRPLIENGHR